MSNSTVTLILLIDSTNDSAELHPQYRVTAQSDRGSVELHTVWHMTCWCALFVNPHFDHLHMQVEFVA